MNISYAGFEGFYKKKEVIDYMEYVEYITRSAVWKMHEINFALSFGKDSAGTQSPLLNSAIQERCTLTRWRPEFN